jgi:hypothetical protein
MACYTKTLIILQNVSSLKAVIFSKKFDKILRNIKSGSYSTDDKWSIRISDVDTPMPGRCDGTASAVTVLDTVQLGTHDRVESREMSRKIRVFIVYKHEIICVY